MKSDLAQEEWLDVYQQNGVNEAYEIFIHKLLFYYEKNIPLVRKKSYKKIKNPWITKGIINSILTRNNCIRTHCTNHLKLTKKNTKSTQTGFLTSCSKKNQME